VPRPNIVIMLADDHRWDALGVVQREQGARGRFPFLRDALPNLDRLAGLGVRFRNAFVVSSLCSPSRAAFLTGRYNHLNGVTDNHTPFPLARTTYATLLRGAGYRTGYFGKWHMGRQRERPGFDEHASFIEHGTYFNATFVVNGVDTPTTGWIDDVSTGYALEFIRRHAHGPFLLVLGFKSPHVPSEPAARHRSLFAGAMVRPAPNATAYAPYDPTPQPPGVTFTLGYFRTLVGIDDNVGRVLEVLDQTGIADDTVVVYASDNGYFLGEHGITGLSSPDGGKRNAYEESIRIPLLLRYPRRVPAGARQDAQVLNIDLAPTLLDLAGLPPPAPMQGKSWQPLLTGAVARLRGRFLYEYFHEPPYIPPTMVALRRGDYKLIRYPGRPAWRELFDLRADPYERRNLSADPASQGVLQIMRDALDAEIVLTGYRVPAHPDRPR
jgi:arylsulfatase A-like enzyme